MSGIFGGDTPTPAPMPIPEPPKATPMVDEAAIARKKKQKMAAYQQRGGRQSTLLGSTALGEAEDSA